MIRCLLPVAAGLLLLSAHPALAGPTVDLPQGRLIGARDEGIRIFKAVPYAAAPVGDLRWRSPGAAPAWRGERNATVYGPSCPQIPFAGDSQPLEPVFSEDCLTLNIWTPEGPGPHPVMVWIHGGGFMNGGAATPTTDGRALARQGVVVVTFNYRLGRLGFFAHPALTAETPDGPLGNYGFLDQLAALRWVKANIAVFGGDPAAVTVFGESAGGGSVAGLLTSSLAEGLFARVIIQSGGGRGAAIPIRGPSPDGGPSMEEVGVTFSAEAGVTGDGPDAARRLRALPADRVIGGVNMLTNNDRARTVNWMLDGVVAREEPLTAMMDGRFAHTPVMIGANGDELGSLSMIDLFARQTLAAFGEDAEDLRAAYGEALNRLPSDAVFVEPARIMARIVAASGQPVFHYSFDYVAEPLRGPGRGARHASEIPYVFNNPDVIPGATDADRATAAAVSAAWVCFARTGDPGCAGWTWPAYGQTRATLVIDGPNPRVATDRDRARLDLIERAYRKKARSNTSR